MRLTLDNGPETIDTCPRILTFVCMSPPAELTAGRAVTLVKETSVVLGLTLFLPFVVHILPSWDDSPLGSHLLPIFYAPLGALILNRMGIAVFASFLAPWINHLLTGHPVVPMAALLCLQLMVFLMVGAALIKREFPGWSIGPAGYVVALLVSSTLGTVFQLMGRPFPLNLARAPEVLWKAVPGILILAIIGLWFSKHKPHSA